MAVKFARIEKILLEKMHSLKNSVNFMVWNNLPLFHEFLIYLSLFNDATAQDATIHCKFFMGKL